LISFTLTTHFVSKVVRASLASSNLNHIQGEVKRLAPILCHNNTAYFELLRMEILATMLSPFSAQYPHLAASYGRGSLVSGILNIGSEIVRIELMDPRGFNPPFGHGEHFQLLPNDLILFWAAQPVLIPPQSGNVYKIEVGYLGLSESSLVRLLDFERDPCYSCVCCVLNLARSSNTKEGRLIV
jgi:hypothetical protein